MEDKGVEVTLIEKKMMRQKVSEHSVRILRVTYLYAREHLALSEDRAKGLAVVGLCRWQQGNLSTWSGYQNLARYLTNIYRLPRVQKMTPKQLIQTHRWENHHFANYPWKEKKLEVIRKETYDNYISSIKRDIKFYEKHYLPINRSLVDDLKVLNRSPSLLKYIDKAIPVYDRWVKYYDKININL